MRSVPIAIVYLVLSALALVAAASVPAPWPLLGIWAALSCQLVAIAYLGHLREVFAKDESRGVIPWHRKLLLGPVLLFTWGTWLVVQALSREPPYQKVSSELYVGRRLGSRAYPDDVASVVDLTCELDEQLPPKGVRYRLLPLLDGAPLRSEVLLALAQELSKLPRPLYVHCAYGHGRAAIVAAAVLHLLEPSLSPKQALDRIAEARPSVRPSRGQKAALLAIDQG